VPSIRKFDGFRYVCVRHSGDPEMTEEQNKRQENYEMEFDDVLTNLDSYIWNARICIDKLLELRKILNR
jgi:hypothetical protein